MATSGFIAAPKPLDERTEDWTLYAQRFEYFLSGANPGFLEGGGQN